MQVDVKQGIENVLGMVRDQLENQSKVKEGKEFPEDSFYKVRFTIPITQNSLR